VLDDVIAHQRAVREPAERRVVAGLHAQDIDGIPFSRQVRIASVLSGSSFMTGEVPLQ
jgi:hypothetical protein